MSLWQISGECVAVADPELRFTPSGLAVASLRVVTNDVKRGDNGAWEKGDPCFLTMTVWKQQAEHLTDTVQKGDTLTVSGRLTMREWEAEDGSKRTSYEIRPDYWGVSGRWNAWSKVESQKDAATPGATDPWGSPPSDQPPF